MQYILIMGILDQALKNANQSTHQYATISIENNFL